MKAKGFTLAIATLAILIVVAWDSTREAGAQTLTTQSQLGIFLTANNIPFIWNSDAGRLTILNSPNASRWATAAAACAELKAQENRLNTVVLSEASESNADAELIWSAEQTLSNLDGRDVADCL
jgi:hypothetical protein